MSDPKAPRVEVRPLTDALPDNANVNKHTARGSKLLENSMRRRGFFRPIAAAGKGVEHPVIKAGNLTQETAVNIGLDQEAIFVYTDGTRPIVHVRTDIAPDSVEAAALAIEDNRVAEESLDWDLDLLATLAAGDSAILAALRKEDQTFSGMLERMGVDGETADAEPQAGANLIGIKRQRWSAKYNFRFLSIRSFSTEKKKREIEILKSIKRDKPQDVSAAIAHEIASSLIDTFINLDGFVVACAPSHKTGFSVYLAELVAGELGIDFIDLFHSELEENAPRRIFGDRPAITAQEINQGIIWIDDTLTTGQTLEACRGFVEGVPFIPVVWIYDDAQEFA
jgi:hypothetical protein